jgi:calcineurin-like phosphoesterase family protein
MIFFTSDTHFGHLNIIKHDNRPFDNVEHMDEELIRNWNSVVTPQDQVWHLGDLCHRSKKGIVYYLNQLNGSIHLIYGNHDDEIRKKYSHLFSSCHDAHCLRHDGQKIVLYHYGQRTWRAQHHGSWHLYGHSHGSLPSYGKSMDVGCMIHGYKPISFEEIKEIMSIQSVEVADKHKMNGE